MSNDQREEPIRQVGPRPEALAVVLFRGPGFHPDATVKSLNVSFGDC